MTLMSTLSHTTIGTTSLRLAVNVASTAVRRAAALYSSPVILYHSTFAELPATMSTGVHNVHPDILAEQIEWLAKSLDFISIDEWFEAGQPAGTAAVTFDDGYQSVCDLAIPLLIEMGIPSTIFLNGASFHGERFWRDKVLFLINTGRVGEFLESESARAGGLGDIDPAAFYSDSKDPARNSRTVDLAIDEFLASQGLFDHVPNETSRRRQDLVHHPLVTYGNHSYRHYIPSSLTEADQREELQRNEHVLDELGVNRSRVYSIPFGDRKHVNSVTESLVAEMDFTGVLFSSNAVNFSKNASWAGLPSGQRYMAPSDLVGFKFHHARLAWLAPDARIRSAARSTRSVVRALKP